MLVIIKHLTKNSSLDKSTKKCIVRRYLKKVTSPQIFWRELALCKLQTKGG